MTENIGIGSVIGGYRLDGLLGQGGMGVVYLAENVQTGAKCALKLLTPDLARQSGFRERFVREARYANSIQHPNIIEVYVSQLRRKVDEPFGRHSIETVRGQGYRFRIDGSA